MLVVTVVLSFSCFLLNGNSILSFPLCSPGHCSEKHWELGQSWQKALGEPAAFTCAGIMVEGVVYPHSWQWLGSNPVSLGEIASVVVSCPENRYLFVFQKYSWIVRINCFDVSQWSKWSGWKEVSRVHVKITWSGNSQQLLLVQCWWKSK